MSGLDKSSNNDSLFDPQRIRGLHRRRVLSSLSRSDMTVAEISRFTNLRMPHVSAELRRLRRENWLIVLPQLVQGSVHLPHALGEESCITGHNTQGPVLFAHPLDKKRYLSVFRDRDRLVLASTVVINQLTIAIPDRQPTVDYSSGNQGVNGYSPR